MAFYSSLDISESAKTLLFLLDQKLKIDKKSTYLEFEGVKKRDLKYN